MRKSLYGLAAAATLLPATVCNAQSTMIVRVRDLDLGSRSGAAIALQRMDAAAQLFCHPGQRELDYPSILCRRDMTARAVAQLNKGRVTHLYMASPATFEMASR